jgi:hypothetical protein
MNCREHLFMGDAMDIVRNEHIIRLFLHTWYSRVCPLLQHRLRVGWIIDVIRNFWLLLSEAFRQKLPLIGCRQRWRVLPLHFDTAESHVAVECLERLLSVYEVLGSNLGTDTSYPLRYFVVFLTIWRQIPGRVSYFLSHAIGAFFLICTIRSTLIPLFDASQSELLDCVLKET